MIVRIIQFLVGSLIAAGGLFIFFRNVNASRLLAELAASNLFFVALCGVLAILTLYFRTIRWRITLPRTGPGQKHKLFELVMIGFAINNILPAHIGDAARALLLWRRNGFPAVIALGAMVIERVMDLLTLFLFFAIPVFFLPQLHDLSFPFTLGTFHRIVPLTWIAFFLIGLVIISITIMVLYALSPTMVITLGSRCSGALPKKLRATLGRIFRESTATLWWIKSWERVLLVVVLSILIELCYCGCFLLLILPFNFSGILGSLFGQAFASIGAAIPLAPGYIGTVHATILQGLTMLGYDPEKSRAFAIIFHAVGFICVTVLGLYYMFRTKLSFKELSKAKTSLESTQCKPEEQEIKS